MLNIESSSSIADPEERLKTVLNNAKQRVNSEKLSLSGNSQKMDRVFVKKGLIVSGQYRNDKQPSPLKFQDMLEEAKEQDETDEQF
jgi:hypothetical protein